MHPGYALGLCQKVAAMEKRRGRCQQKNPIIRFSNDQVNVLGTYERRLCEMIILCVAVCIGKCERELRRGEDNEE